MIQARTAFTIFGILAALAFLTLDGQPRLVALGVIAVFVLRTYITILQRRQVERELQAAKADADPEKLLYP